VKHAATIQEIAAALAVKKRWAQTVAGKEHWPFENGGGRGAPRYYPIESLPENVRAAVLLRREREKAQPEQSAEVPPESASDTLAAAWENFRSTTQAHREQALKRVMIVQKVEALIGEGIKVGAALRAVAKEFDEKIGTVDRWRDTVINSDRPDWAALLTPNYSQCGRPRGERNEAAWEFYKTLYLREEKPSHAYCFRLLKRTALKHGWKIASARTYKRWVDEIDLAIVEVRRRGQEALHQMYPPQERTRIGIDVMHTVTCDGYRHNVFVRWPDGTVKRPMTWFIQDLKSGRIVAHRTSWSENTEIISGSLLDLLEIGVPKVMILDNTRSAANKQMTGGIENRYRDHLRPDEPLGKLPLLGINVTFTSVYEFGGSGQSKSVEAAFRNSGGLGEVIDKFPAFAGAWTGSGPSEKPENYNPNKAIPLDVFLSIKDQEVIAWNAQPARRNETCAGKLSFDDAFEMGLKTAQVKKANEDQRAMVRMDFEAVTVSKYGTFKINTGRIAPIDGARTGGYNRFYHPLLVNEVGKKVIAWVDPRDLHKPVQVRDLDGTFICEAQILEKRGHNDKDAARIDNNNRAAWKKGIKQAAKALTQLTIGDAAAMIPGVTPPVFSPAAVVEIMQTPHLGAKGSHEQTLSAAEQADVAEKVAQINTELNALNKASAIVDREDISACVHLYGRLAGKHLTGEQQIFCTWFEGESGYMATYELLKDDIDFDAGGLPRGRTAG